MNGRRAKQLRRAQIQETLARARMQPPRHIASRDGLDYFQRGSAIFAVPVIPDDAAPELKNALAARRAASLNGICACGARTEIVTRDTGAGTVIAMQHAQDCLAHDDSIRRIVRSTRAREGKP